MNLFDGYIGRRPKGAAEVLRMREWLSLRDGRLEPLNPRFGVRSLSPGGFDWGYCGSGSAQLALAILCDVLDNNYEALELYERFQRQIVAVLPEKLDWALSKERVLTWVRQARAEESSAST